MGKKIKRRDLLKNGALLGAASMAPLNLFKINQALASDYQENKKYVLITLPGAPLRTYFDLPLNPFGGEDEVIFQPRGIGNRYVLNNETDRYEDYRLADHEVTVNGETIRMPWLWQFSVPSTSGEDVPMTALLEDMFMFRGLNNFVPAHPAARRSIYHPRSSTYSVTALLADFKQDPIAEINGTKPGFGHSFVSRTNKSCLPISVMSNEWYDKLVLYPLTISQGREWVYDKRFQFQEQRASVLNLINNYARDLHISFEGIVDNIEGSEHIKNNETFPDESVINDRVQVYQDLIRDTFSKEYSGLNDKPIGCSLEDRENNQEYSVDADNIEGSLDIRKIVRFYNTPSHINRMARGFVLAELAIEKNLSSTISLDIFGISNLNINLDIKDQNFDEHYTGPMVSIYMNSMFFLAFGACLLEFRSKLMDIGKWDDTVVQISSEFGRKPNGSEDDLSQRGTEHAPEATSMSFLSGKINGPHVAGNIKIGNANTGGTWGAQAATPINGVSTSLHFGHYEATLKTLLGIDSETSNGDSLVSVEDDGTFTCSIEAKLKPS